jgi:aspartate ammonia-lyase
VLETKRSVKDIVKERNLMSEKEWEELMEIDNLTTPTKG